MFMNQKEPGEIQIFCRFTAEDLCISRRPTIAQNLWLPAGTHVKKCWNSWLWTIFIWSSVTRWRPMKASNSRGVSCACSVCPHQFKAPMRRWILTSMNPTGLRRMSSSWFWGSRTTSGQIEGSLSLQRSTPAGPAPPHEAGSLLRRAQGGPRLSTRRRRRLHVQVPLVRAAHTHTHSLTLPAKAEHAGALPCTCARFHWVRARACSVSFGRGGVAGSQRGKPEDEDTESDTDLAVVQKGPKYFMRMCCIAICAYIQPYCIYCISGIFFIFSIYFLCIALVHIYCLYIAYSSYFAYFWSIYVYTSIKCIFSMYYIRCIYMYILPILLLCPAAVPQVRRRSKRNAAEAELEEAAAAAGRAGRRPGRAGRWNGPGGAPGSPYQGESASACEQ